MTSSQTHLYLTAFLVSSWLQVILSELGDITRRALIVFWLYRWLSHYIFYCLFVGLIIAVVTGSFLIITLILVLCCACSGSDSFKHPKVYLLLNGASHSTIHGMWKRLVLIGQFHWPLSVIILLMLLMTDDALGSHQQWMESDFVVRSDLPASSTFPYFLLKYECLQRHYTWLGAWYRVVVSASCLHIFWFQNTWSCRPLEGYEECTIRLLYPPPLESIWSWV